MVLTLSFIIGFLLPIDLDSQELMDRTYVGIDSVVLALASGTAAANCNGCIMLGSGQIGLAFGAVLLLAVYIVCVNLAAKVVFLARGAKPRIWLEKRKAKQSMTAYMVFWNLSLLVLLIAIYLRGHL